MSENDFEYPIYDGPCKKIHHEPYYTPNNFDLSFDTNKIPSNIEMESAVNLQKRLQDLMPASKIIHLDLTTDELSKVNHFVITSKLKINGKGVKFIWKLM